MFLRTAPESFDGLHLLPGAIHLDGGCSVSREKYMERVPFDCLSPHLQPGKCCIAATRVLRLPTGEHTDGEGRAFRLSIADDPLDAEGSRPAIPAHAEIRLHRTDAPYDPNQRLPRSLRSRVCALIARAFRECYRGDTGSPGTCPPAGHPNWNGAGGPVTLPPPVE